MYPPDKTPAPSAKGKQTPNWQRAEVQPSPYDKIPDMNPVSPQKNDSPYDKLPDFNERFPQKNESPYDKLPADDVPAPAKKESPYGKMPKLEGPILGKPESPYGRLRDVTDMIARAKTANGGQKADSAPAKSESPYGYFRDVTAPTMKAQPVTTSANGKRPLPKIPLHVDPAAVNGKEHIVTERNATNDSHGGKERSVSPVRDQDFFMGRVMSQKGSGGLVLKSTMNAEDQKADLLVHLPKSAVDQLKSADGFEQAMHNSMTYGNQGESLGITHTNGKWSYSGTGLPPKNLSAKNTPQKKM